MRKSSPSGGLKQFTMSDNRLEANLIVLKRHRDLIDAYISANEKWIEKGRSPSESIELKVSTFQFYKENK